jgi:hypothetical protein
MFKQMLEYGQRFEKQAQQHIISYMKTTHNINCEIVEECCDSRYDFKIMDTATKKTYTFEVKADKASIKTNNFFIETNGYDMKPSGLTTTKANFYIITDETNFYLLKTDTLKYIINNNNFKIRALGPRDNITSLGVIVPCDIIIKQAKKIN